MTPTTALFASYYSLARERFLDAASARGARITTFENELSRGPHGERLFVDVASIGTVGADQALVLVSGTHGIEGFAGSAAQLQLLLHGWETVPPSTAVVLVHALNPFGFAHRCRVNEHNVDINRNFVDHANPPHHPDYELVHQALVPADWQGEPRKAADLAIGTLVRTHGLRFVQRAITRGQYRHADGLFYGGRSPEWSNRTWRHIIRSELMPFRRIAYIDLHTGLGERGHGEPIFRGGTDAGAFDRALRWYGNALTRSENGTSSSTPIIGNTASALAEEVGEGREITAITLEFGTEAGSTVLAALRADNWLRERGDPSGPDAVAIKQMMVDAFCPDDPAWREAVLADARRFIGAACRGLGSRQGWAITTIGACEECGYDPSSVTVGDVADRLRRMVTHYEDIQAKVKARPDLARTRVMAGVWSPLEYLTHVRDVFNLFERRARCILAVPEPQLEVVDHDDLVRKGAYNSLDPDAVIEEVAAAAEALASTLQTVQPDQWGLRGLRAGEPRTITDIALRAVHEGEHHFMDIVRGMQAAEAIGHRRILTKEDVCSDSTTR